MEEKKVDKKWIIIGAVVVGAILVSFILPSPSEKLGEQMAENFVESAIEQQTGGAVDIDVSGENYTMETEDGSFQAGENVKLPANFPSDVYVFEGKLVAVMQSNENSILLSIETDKKVSEVKEVYIQKLKDDGWKQTGLMDFGDSVSVSSEKEGRSVTVMVSGSSEGLTTISLTVVDESSMQTSDESAPTLEDTPVE